MKKSFLLLVLCIPFTFLSAQYPLVRIDSVQQVSAPNLAVCLDTSPLFGDTVKLRGIVLMDGGLAQSAGGRNIWIMNNGTGNWRGIDLYGSSSMATSPDDVLDLVAGDSIEITGKLDEYQGETEIMPLTSGTGVQIISSGNPIPAPVVVNISDLNDAARLNKIPTGEQYEGMFVEVQSVTVQSIDPFGANRVSFNVVDGLGNKLNVSDRFIVGRTPANGGTFVPPNVGDQYCTLRGILMHSKNDCPGFNNGRGYEIHPFDTSHYQICSAAPSIFNVSRNRVTPTSSQNVTVSAQITDGDGVDTASLFYAVGATNSTYISVPMVNSTGSTYTADIPAQVNGAFVKYYVCATDNIANTSCNTNVPGGSNAYFYTVRDSGTTIYDVQYVPIAFANGNSGYVDMEVTVTGVVTASAEPGNLGYVFIQEEGRLDWGGIMLLGSASLSTLQVGQKITVTGDVKEANGFTRIENVSSIVSAGSGTITPLRLSPSNFTTYAFATNEAYESMLIEIHASPASLYVVDDNADGPPSNFGEYRVGGDQFDPSTGCRVLAGRQTSSAFSSLNVSFVNDSMWATVDGLMNVPVCKINTGDMFDSIVGIMYYSFGAFKMLPRNNSDFFGNLAWCLNVSNEDDILQNGQFVVYPNPASSEVGLSYQLPANIHAAEVSLWSLNGKRMTRESLTGSSGNIQLNTESLSSGVYLLQISEGNAVFSNQKLIITR